MIYVNGQLIGAGFKAQPDMRFENPLYIGTLNGQPFAGRIDEVSIYNRALSADEINAIYKAGI